jgi:hypothetical protein
VSVDAVLAHLIAGEHPADFVGEDPVHLAHGAVIGPVLGCPYMPGGGTVLAALRVRRPETIALLSRPGYPIPPASAIPGDDRSRIDSRARRSVTGLGTAQPGTALRSTSFHVIDVTQMSYQKS